MIASGLRQHAMAIYLCLASWRATSSSCISSSSVSCLTAKSRFFGRTCRCEAEAILVA